jgi:membrane protein YfhO
MASRDQGKACAETAGSIFWLWAGGLAVIALPWLQRWLYIFPELDHRLFWGGDFVELAAQRGYFFHMLAQGKLVLWDPLMGTGQPFMSYLFDLFNPFSLITTFFLEDGLLRSDFAQIMLAVYCSLAGLGAFLLGLQLNLGRTAATLMGMVMGCMGVVVGHSHHSMMIQTLCWTPYIFLFLYRGRAGSRLLNGAWAGIFFGLCFIGGIPQIFYYFMLAIGLYVVYWAVLDVRQGGWPLALSRGLPVYLALGAASGLIALPNLVHLFMSALGDPLGVHDGAALLGSNRLTFTQQGSAPWGILVSFLEPGLLWGRDELLSYVGIIPLALALVAVVQVRRPAAGFWKLMCLAGVILMMGGHFGLHKVLLDLLPGYYLFRISARWIFLTHLGLLVLAGYGLVWLWSRPPAEDLKPLRRFLAVVSAMLLGIILAVAALASLGIEGQNLGNTLPLLSRLGWPLFMLCALWWVMHRLGQGAPLRALGLLLVALVALDLGFYYAPMTAWDRSSFGRDPSQISQQQDQRAARLASLARGIPPKRILIKRDAPTAGFMGDLYRHRLDLINPPGGYMDRMLPLGFWQIWWQKEANPRFLDLLSVKMIQNDSPLAKTTRDHWSLVGYSQSAVPLAPAASLSRLTLRAEVRLAHGLATGTTLAQVALVRQGRPVTLWPLRLGKELRPGQVIELALPRAMAAQEVVLASTHATALVEVSAIWADGRRLLDRVPLKALDRDFSTNIRALEQVFFVSRAAVIEPKWEYLEALASLDPSRSLIFRRPPPGHRPPQAPALTPGGRVKVQSWQNQDVTLQVSAQRDGYLVMSQSAYQGWRATVDGQPAPILKAYGFLIAVPIPQGQHEINLVYDEPLLKASLAVPPLLIIVIIAWSLWAGRRRRSFRQKDPRPKA